MDNLLVINILGFISLFLFYKYTWSYILPIAELYNGNLFQNENMCCLGILKVYCMHIDIPYACNKVCNVSVHAMRYLMWGSPT